MSAPEPVPEPAAAVEPAGAAQDTEAGPVHSPWGEPLAAFDESLDRYLDNVGHRLRTDGAGACLREFKVYVDGVPDMTCSYSDGWVPYDPDGIVEVLGRFFKALRADYIKTFTPHPLHHTNTGDLGEELVRLCQLLWRGDEFKEIVSRANSRDYCINISRSVIDMLSDIKQHVLPPPESEPESHAAPPSPPPLSVCLAGRSVY